MMSLEVWVEVKSSPTPFLSADERSADVEEIKKNGDVEMY